ncbi:MAG: HAD-IIIC family phosphatase, partial [Proteobacteria bacterium]|nr:HAD-IIIC family phosphatase [Pseudomonadota bacterium]
SDLNDFKPDIVYIFTSYRNLTHGPSFSDKKNDVDGMLENVLDRHTSMWSAIKTRFNVPIIQNNYEYAPTRDLGNIDTQDFRGTNHFILELNRLLKNSADKVSGVYLNDIHYLSAKIGLAQWHDSQYWYAFKYAMSQLGMMQTAHSSSRIINAIYGKSKKCLILDLDNTLWGGVIGDDGEDGILLGQGEAKGEAYQDFQKYIKRLSDRGVILSVASKNEHAIAKTGFNHSQTILKYEDFSSFKANWGPKDQSIRDICFEINIGLDSTVFLDDNPAERLRVESEISEIVVPPLPVEPFTYVDILDRGQFFEPLKIVDDDLKRKQFYSDNLKRSDLKSNFSNYDDYLKSLEMAATISKPSRAQLERVTQLINKTNQFNLTTKRLTYSEVDSIWQSQNSLILAGQLKDKFGDNGLISVIIGNKIGSALEIVLWIMSCRVLKRGMENAMLDKLVKSSTEMGISQLIGEYIPTAKNALVRNHYQDLGFSAHNATKATGSNESTKWLLDIKNTQKTYNQFIEV